MCDKQPEEVARCQKKNGVTRIIQFDTTLTNLTTTLAISNMLSHAALWGGIKESNGPKKCMECSIAIYPISPPPPNDPSEEAMEVDRTETSGTQGSTEPASNTPAAPTGSPSHGPPTTGSTSATPTPTKTPQKTPGKKPMNLVPQKAPIQEIPMTKEETINFSLSDDDSESFPALSAITSLYTGSNTAANPNMDTDAPPPISKASLDALNKYLQSLQFDCYEMPCVMEVETTLAMMPRDFQSQVNEGLVVLVGPPGSTTFNIPTLYRLVVFSSDVECIDSDMLQKKLPKRCVVGTSQPLIVTTASRYTHAYQEVEKLLNAQKVVLANFPDHHFTGDVHAWQGPLISAMGLIQPPLQNPNSVGISLHCVMGHVVFFLPILQASQHLIMAFNDMETSTSLGFEYLYHPPHTFTSIVLLPCQTMIFPPGQVYAYTTVSLEEQEPNTFDVLLEEFSDLKIANCAWNPEEMDAQEHEECCTKSISFRKNMLEAIKHIVPEPGDE
ncbi:uncharacterized protein EI90DRAFT_3246409 [Cantharellus anzutake]|uniref:uncharacterized protein n=1 Tax=Cantharellus anzutake TaxID=1750568 RepID=UPI0019060CFA|nr:uncharacterized protein EI90DRAFT_3246409 [Cantharellus anzutake]KAF8322958.1 hypothetical protein EI90DRAFT_3246409 [Cantharellus anzutake]